MIYPEYIRILLPGSPVIRKLIFGNLVITAIYLLTGCSDNTVQWGDIVASGKLRFVTIENPATYYNTPSGPAGFEYELAHRFALQHGLELELLIANTAFEAIEMVRYNKAIIAGAALIQVNIPGVKPGPSYYSVPLQLIYRNGNEKPDGINHLNYRDVAITQVQYLTLKETYPYLRSVIHKEEISTLAEKIQNNNLRYGVMNDNMVDAFRYMYPDIRVATDLTPPAKVGWVYNRQVSQLGKLLKDFFNRLNASGELQILQEQNFGHIETFDYVDSSTFIKRIRDRLPRYRETFIKIANKYNVDWTLLAAMSYQESHWDENARSATGVRGLMMLTQNTARHVGIDDRLDPEQSIEGGTRYLLELREKIPSRIADPDRLWFALAAYNIGLLHLENARVITQGIGKDPDSWQDVRSTLIAIVHDDAYQHLQAGNIRWLEPVQYVNRIRKYYDALRWYLMQQEKISRKSLIYDIPFRDSPVL